MQLAPRQITPCLWFDTEAEEAAKFYVSVFEDARIGKIARYGGEGREVHGREAGTVMTAEFEIAGQPFLALNGGPQFTFSEAVSFQVPCKTQAEIDYLWTTLGEGGQEGPCGWLKDRYGLSWQIVPTVLPKMLSDADRERSDRVMKTFLQMKKFDIAALERAYEGA